MIPVMIRANANVKRYQILQPVNYVGTEINDIDGIIYIGSLMQPGLIFAELNQISRISSMLGPMNVRTKVLADYVFLKFIKQSKALRFRVLDVELSGFESSYFPKTVVKDLIDNGNSAALSVTLESIAQPITAVTFVDSREEIDPYMHAKQEGRLIDLSNINNTAPNTSSESAFMPGGPGFLLDPQIHITLHGSGLITVISPSFTIESRLRELFKRLTSFLLEASEDPRPNPQYDISPRLRFSSEESNTGFSNQVSKQKFSLWEKFTGH